MQPDFFDLQSENRRVTAAKNEFHQARMRGALQAIGARLTGRSIELLSFEDVADKLKITGRASRGVEAIPVAAIVGSVGRYHDFTRTFLPRLESDADRWAAVRLAAQDMTELPPIEVYEVGDAYFVLDGNHRVSIARQQGLDYIDAYVTEIHTRVTLSADDRPDELIIKAEYANFLAFTHLDQLRPGADMRVSVPGQYETLENHIEVHRYFIEEAHEQVLADVEAVCRWYDEAYMPMVAAIREQGILRYFPGRTETDFYVWLAAHQAHLRNELGWEVEPDVIVKLASRFEPRSERLMQRISRQVLDVIVPERRSLRQSQAATRWSQKRVVDRYSERLFADILVPMQGNENDEAVITQAVVLARREGARLFTLYVTADLHHLADAEDSERLCRRHIEEAGLELRQAREVGDVVEKICDRAALTDLVVLPSSFSTEAVDDMALQQVLLCCSRPVLVAPPSPTGLERVLLAYDGGDKAQEGLFVAAYLAEAWGASLTVLTVLEGGEVEAKVVDHARRYLTMHEVEATFVVAEGEVAVVMEETAVTHDANLLIMGGYRTGRWGRRRLGRTVTEMLTQQKRPILICP